MKKRMLALLVLAAMLTCLLPRMELRASAEEEVVINETNFPDEIFRENVVRAYDSDENGSLSEEERGEVTRIVCEEMGISSLQGVEFFHNLRELWCYGNQLTSLNLAGLTQLEILVCNENQLTALDVTGCPDLRTLNCYQNRLTELDVTNCSSLEELICYYNQLTELDVTNCPKLYDLWCSANKLTVLDIGSNPILEAVFLMGASETYTTPTAWYFNGVVESDDGNEYSARLSFDRKAALWLSDGSVFEDPHNSELQINEENFPDEIFRTYVYSEFDTDSSWSLSEEEIAAATEICIPYDVEIESMEGIQFFPWLERLECSSNLLTELDLTANPLLRSVDCSSNQLKSLDVSQCSELEYLNCGRNRLTTLDLSGLSALETLNCSDNRLDTLDLSGCSALATLECNENSLSALDLSECTGMKRLDCSTNQLASLDLSGNPALTDLSCNNNLLTSLDVSGNPALTELGCDNNLLTSLDVSSNPALTGLGCANNLLTSLDVSGNTELIALVCSGNQLTSLDVRANATLAELYCEDNQLTELYFAELGCLNCANNRLTELDVGAAPRLAELFCTGNQIEQLDLSNNPALEQAILHGELLASCLKADYWAFRWFSMESVQYAPFPISFSFDRSTSVRMSDGSLFEINPFSDVPANKYFYLPVIWASHSNPLITGGTDATHFSPDKTCTREQIVTFLWKSAGAPDWFDENTTNPFTDVKPGKYYEKAVLWTVEKGITGGVSANKFGVGKPCTREQAVSFLWKNAGSPEPETEECPFSDVQKGKYYYKAVLWAVENGITGGVGGGKFGVGKPCTRAQIVTFIYKVYMNSHWYED